MILLAMAIILFLMLDWLGKAMRPSVVNGVNDGGNAVYGISWYVAIVAFLFLLPFSIVSFIWPKVKLWLRIVIGIVFIWPMWTLMILSGGGL